ELVNALLEYKRYKEMSEELSISEAQQRKVNYRGNYNSDEKTNPDELNTLLKNITIYDLIKAFKKAIEERPREAVHEVERFNVSIEEQIEDILSKTDIGKEITFIDLIKDMMEKIRIIVTFIALLELIKMGRIGLKESPNYNDFIIYGIVDG
ncbi:MAG: segregation/condensation protein A, partial [Melioribacteraceae bacterium]|nr:segregation/condensation protein A [Melioribacteraceae bacterium]